MNMCSYIACNHIMTIEIDNDQITELAEMFSLLGEPSRLKIILTCLDGEQSVGAIQAKTGLSQSLVSHHLRLLRAARLMKKRKEGKQVFYHVADEHIACVLRDMTEHVAEECHHG